MIRQVGKWPFPEPVIGEPCDDPVFIAAFRANRERAERNHKWLADHIEEIVALPAGLYICIAGQELFTGTDFHEVRNRARAAPPDDWGAFYESYQRAGPGTP